MEDDERWKELCALAAKEQDADRLLMLVEVINQLREEGESRLRFRSKLDT